MASMILRKRKFRPSVWMTMGAFLATAGLVKLGLWQLDRADEKRVILFEYETRSEDRPEPGALSDQDAQLARYKPLVINGRFDGARQFLLDNIVHRGRVGYQVLTPFEMEDGGWLIVNRGWWPSGGTREALPPIEIDDTRRTILGQVDFLPRAGLKVDSGAQLTGWPKVVQYPDMQALSDALAEELYGYQLLLAPDQPDGFVREWEPQHMKPERHVGYAVQWFALGLTLSVIYIVLNLKEVDRQS
jgi:surfeit locus 1 family protein